MSNEAAQAEFSGRFRIMATADIHGQILPYDYYADRPVERPSLAALACLVTRLRDEGLPSILVDNGDFLQGNPMADWAAAEGRCLRHPIIAAMNAMRFDAAALGNHEFNYGLDVLDKVLGEADFPMLSANLSVEGWAVAPWTIINRIVTAPDGQSRPLRIGVIGLSPPQICQWERLILDGRLQASDMLATAQSSVAAVKAEGADLIVVLAHTGIGHGDMTPFAENTGLALSRVAGIDALVLGHVHDVFPSPECETVDGVDWQKGTLSGVPTVMPGDCASHIGVIDLDLRHDGGSWRVVGHDVRAIGVAHDLPHDDCVAATMAEAHGHVLQKIRADVGFTDRRIHSHFALVHADESLQVVADAQSFAVRAALADTAYADLPLLSAVAPFRAGGRGGPLGYIDVPKGPLSLSAAAELYLYPNSLCAVETTGAVITEWLERSAGLFHRLHEGVDDQPLIDPAFPSYNFDVLFGVTYEIDLHQPPYAAGGRRIRNLCYDGRPVTSDMRFAVATNTYRAGGAGGYEAVVEGSTIIHRDTRKVRDVVISYLHEMQPRAAQAVWRFAHMPDTHAWFQTHPYAVAPSKLCHALTSLGIDKQGFQRFILDLGALPKA